MVDLCDVRIMYKQGHEEHTQCLVVLPATAAVQFTHTMMITHPNPLWVYWCSKWKDFCGNTARRRWLHWEIQGFEESTISNFASIPIPMQVPPATLLIIIGLIMFVMLSIMKREWTWKDVSIEHANSGPKVVKGSLKTNDLSFIYSPPLVFNQWGDEMGARVWWIHCGDDDSDDDGNDDGIGWESTCLRPFVVSFLQSGADGVGVSTTRITIWRNQLMMAGE